MKQLIFASLLAIGLGFGLTSCFPEASEHEILQMCEQLAALRRRADDQKMIKKCIQEANKEGVSKRQALCRISAVNKLEYWNRCRTGEARPKN